MPPPPFLTLHFCKTEQMLPEIYQTFDRLCSLYPSPFFNFSLRHCFITVCWAKNVRSLTDFEYEDHLNAEAEKLIRSFFVC